MLAWFTTRHRLPLRWYLVIVVIGAMLPIVAFTTLLVVRLSAYERSAVERDLVETATALATDLDRSVRATVSTLEAMAQSPHLDGTDLAAFYAEAQRVLPTQAHWRALVVLAPSGQQLMNTLRPLGTALPSANEPESLRRVVEGRQPALGDLTQGRVDGAWAFPVRVPVVRDGDVKYVLTATLTADALAGVIRNARPRHEEWTRALVDRRGLIGARTRAPEAYVGKPGTPEFLRRMALVEHGIYRDTTIDGADVYVAFARAPQSQWTAAIAVPTAVVDGPPRRQLAAVGGLGIALLAVSGVGAFVFARRVARRIGAAAALAEAIAHGEHPPAPESGVEEVARLEEALRQSAALLRRRETERDRLLERAEAANRAKDDFLAMLSHELRTPLTAILGWAGMLRSGRLGPREREQAMDVIQRNARLQRQLIDELLDVSRIVAGKLELELAPTDVRAVVAAAAETMRPAGEAKGITLARADCDQPAVVNGDPARLQQVFVNLLSNAVKFTPAGGRVDVGITVAGGRAIVSVTDTGRGIDPGFLPHIFDRFRQGNVAVTARGGLGLGLAIVHHLVLLHGGGVSAESEGEGRGARFVVTLPLSRAAQPPASAVALEADEPTLAGVRILVVDDEPDTLQMLVAALALQQADVARAMSADEALAALEKFPVDLLVSDIRMPDKDGYALIQAIRRREPPGARRLPAVALTADAGSDDRERARRAGFDVHLGKPVDPQQLVAALVALLSRGDVRVG
ncbi:MAG TPA: ATP-binding protein [Methylomirabilota bacterium]|jgi:signal transduction histidine kinase/ActR/RegA family two-component response regulator